MTRTRILLAALSGLAVLCGPAVAQQSTISEVVQDIGVTLQGTVSDVFGNRFILEDDSGRVLVDTDARGGTALSVTTGERLTVVGQPGPNGFTATRVLREDGTELLSTEAATETRPTPTPAISTPSTLAERAQAPRAGRLDAEQAATLLADAGFDRIVLDEVKGRHFEFVAYDADGREVDIDLFFDGTVKEFDVQDNRRAVMADLMQFVPDVVRAALNERGIVDLREYEAKPRHYEVEGFDASGREIKMEIETDGRVSKIEIDDRAVQSQATPLIGEPELRAAVEQGGYAYDQIAARKNRHFEVLAMNPEGEPVELHIDLAGEIYKEKLRRR